MEFLEPLRLQLDVLLRPDDTDAHRKALETATAAVETRQVGLRDSGLATYAAPGKDERWCQLSRGVSMISKLPVGGDCVVHDRWIEHLMQAADPGKEAARISRICDCLRLQGYIIKLSRKAAIRKKAGKKQLKNATQIDSEMKEPILSEEAWQRRECKRCAVVDQIIRNAVPELPEDAELPLGPDPMDRGISKRCWEKVMVRWRKEIRGISPRPLALQSRWPCGSNGP